MTGDRHSVKIINRSLLEKLFITLRQPQKRMLLYGESARRVCMGSLYGESVWGVCMGSLYGESVWGVCMGSLQSSVPISL